MSTLTDRYVHATVRSVPEARRDDIARELQASIHDMVGDRLEGGEDHVTAERAVLTELGDPDRLAVQYTDGPNHLIGPRYFVMYWRLLRNLLTWIPVPVGVLVGVLDALDSGSAGAVGAGIGAAITAALHVVFWTTLSFAILERTDTDAGLPRWTVDDLPDPPAARHVSVADAITTIVLTTVMGVLLVGQHFRSWVENDAGENVPLLDPAAWQPWLLLALVALVIDVAVFVVLLRHGRWTKPLAMTYLFSGVVFLVPALYLAMREELFNPEFLDVVGLGGQSLSYTHLTIAFGAVIITGLEVIPAITKAWRGDAAAASAADRESQAVR